MNVTPPASSSDSIVGPASHQGPSTTSVQNSPAISFDIPIRPHSMNKSAFALLNKQADAAFFPPSATQAAPAPTAPSQPSGVLGNLGHAINSAGEAVGGTFDALGRQMVATPLERWATGLNVFASPEATQQAANAGFAQREANNQRMQEAVDRYDAGVAGIGQGLRGAGSSLLDSLGFSAPAAAPAPAPAPAATAPPAQVATPNPPQTPTLQAPSNVGPVKSTAAPGGIAGLFKAPMTSPGLAPSPAAAPAAAKPAAPANAASTDWNKRFFADTRTKFDPNSAMDRENMRRLQAGQRTLDAKQYGAMNKSAFALLEKQAATGKAFGALVKGVGNLLSRSGAAAKTRAGVEALEHATGARSLSRLQEAMNAGQLHSSIKSLNMPGLRRIMADARSQVGNTRVGHGQSLKALGSELAAGDTGLAKAVNYGGNAAIGGGLLYGANRMGHSSGRAEGIGQGYDVGADAAIDAVRNNSAASGGNSGYFGNLWNAIKGETGSDGGGVNMGAAYQEVGSKRDAAIRQLLGIA